MKTLTLTTLAAATLLSLPIAASAQQMGNGPMGGPGMGFGPGYGMGFGLGAKTGDLSDFDLDKDGKITKEEVEQSRLKSFADVNKDGTGVDIKNFESWFWQQHHLMMVRAFQHLDTNGDGKISDDEIKAAADAMFTRFDTNGDGVLTTADRPQPGQGFGRGFGRGPGRDMDDGFGRGQGFGHGRHMGPGMGNGMNGKAPRMGWGWGFGQNNAPAPQADQDDQNDQGTQQP